jgi:hypothetical protein
MPRIGLARGLGRRLRWSIRGPPDDGPAATRARAPSTGLVARNVSRDRHVTEGNSLLRGPGLRRRVPGGQWAELLAWTASSPTLATTRRLAGRSPPLRRQR